MLSRKIKQILIFSYQ